MIRVLRRQKRGDAENVYLFNTSCLDIRHMSAMALKVGFFYDD